MLSTTLEQLEQLEEKDWGKNIIVKFIGENAVDAGGPQREMFSLLFQTFIEEETFNVNSVYLQKNYYEILGRAIGYALISGHPGPKNIHPLLVRYIINEKSPKACEIMLTDIPDAGVRAAINEVIQNPSLFTFGKIWIYAHYSCFDYFQYKCCVNLTKVVTSYTPQNKIRVGYYINSTKLNLKLLHGKFE